MTRRLDAAALGIESLRSDVDARQAWRLAEIAALAAIYYATGRLGLSLALPPGHATAVWPPSGLGLAVLMLRGYGAWPAILLGSFFVNIQDLADSASALALAKSTAVASAIAVGSSGQALLGVALIRRFMGSRFPWNRTQDVFKFAGVETLACTVAATVGVTSLSLTGFVSWDTYGDMWSTWWLGDLTGVLIFTPLILVWLNRPRIAWHRSRFIEALLLLGVLALTGVLMFWGPTSARLYPVVPLVLWSAFRFGQRGVVTTSALISIVAISGTAYGAGPFVEGTRNASLLSLQTFVAAIAVTGLALTASLRQRELSEQELRASEQRLRSFMLHSADGVLIIGEDGRIEMANDAAQRMFGYSPDELMGQPIEVLVPEHLRTQHERHRAQYIEAAEARPMGAGLELRALRKDGSAFPVDISLTPLTMAPSVRVAVVVSDITERTEAERRQEILIKAGEVLGSSLAVETVLEQLAGLMVDTMADWSTVAVVTEAGKLQRKVAHSDLSKAGVARQLEHWSPALQEIPAVAEALKLGKSVCVAVDAQARLPDVGARELEVVRALGLRSILIVPMLSRHRLIGAITMVRSESGRDYSAADQKLAEEVATRAALAIENAQLFERTERMREELRRSNEGKDEFLGLMSHELRTPITVISGGARLLRSERALGKPARRDLLADIERESGRLARMLENLLTLSRLELGQRVPVEPVLLQRFVHRVVAAFPRQGAPPIDVCAEAELPPVAAHPDYLELVISNLLNNVEKHCSAASPIEIRLTRTETHAVLSVLDRGPGVPANELGKLFDHFYQSGTGSKRGSGLGLTVCKRLVEAQGGRISAERRAGGGLGVSVSLPLLAWERE